MLGLNQNVRNTPVSSSTTKLHSAISPSMNDQWSGKTLRICFFETVAIPVRSSNQVPIPATGLAFLGVAAVVPLVVPRLLELIVVTHVPRSWGRPVR